MPLIIARNMTATINTENEIMGVFGWDLPPGVNLHDVGSSEYLCEKCGEYFREEDLTPDVDEQICKNCNNERKNQ